MDANNAATSSSSPGLITGVLTIFRNLLGLVINRIELASLELSELSGKLLRCLILFSLAAICLWFAVAFWSVLLVFLAWDSWGWKILAVLAAFFTIAMLAFAWYAYAIVKQGQLSLPATMAELRKDRDALL